MFFNESGVESDFKNLSLSKTFQLCDFGVLFTFDYVVFAMGSLDWNATSGQTKLSSVLTIP